MAITVKEIEHIAKLARLDSAGGKFDKLAQDMQSFVEMVDKLQNLNLGDVTDSINTEYKNALREDKVVNEGNPEKLIKTNAPSFEAGGISVPKVVE